MGSQIWGPITDGTAQGPALYLECGGQRMTCQALWSDEEGVVVSVDTQGECLLDRDALTEIHDAIDCLMSLDPPRVYAPEGNMT